VIHLSIHGFFQLDRVESNNSKSNCIRCHRLVIINALVNVLTQIEVHADRPVGKNFHDHVGIIFGPFLIDKPLSLIPNRDINTGAIQNYAEKGRGPLEFLPFPVTGYLISPTAKAQGERKWPNTQIFLMASGVAQTVVQDYVHTFRIREEISEPYFSPLRGRDAFSFVLQNSRPQSRGWIRLANTDPATPPIIEPNYLAKEADVNVLLEGK